jgi:hypothetical protein
MFTDMEQVKMATAKTIEIETSQRPLIQIDDHVREMNDEEYSELLEIRAGYVSLPELFKNSLELPGDPA